MNELVVVKVVGSEPEAELLCSLLRSADIECALRQTNLGAGAADGMPGGPYELVVRPQDLDDARDVLRERQRLGRAVRSSVGSSGNTISVALLPPLLPPLGVRQWPETPYSTGIPLARPSGFEPETFGSVDRGDHARFGSSKPNPEHRVAKKSPEKSETRPVRARHDRSVAVRPRTGSAPVCSLPRRAAGGRAISSRSAPETRSLSGRPRSDAHPDRGCSSGSRLRGPVGA
jgi:hypothetical protein